MPIRISLLAVLVFALSAYAQAQDKAETQTEPERVFQQVSVEEAAAYDADSALVMGTYVLDSKATEQLLQVDTLMKGIRRIRLDEWKTGGFTKQNAELTVRQQMDRYIQTAGEFYKGEGKRNKGVVGRRQEKYTDLELGDQQLVSALSTVRMATAWDVPLEPGQAERIDAVIRLRLAVINRQPKEGDTRY